LYINDDVCTNLLNVTHIYTSSRCRKSKSDVRARQMTFELFEADERENIPRTKSDERRNKPEKEADDIF